MSDNSSFHKVRSEPTLTKKCYSEPRLTVYGTVFDMTKMVGKSGAKDNPTGNQGQHKTNV